MKNLTTLSSPPVKLAVPKTLCPPFAALDLDWRDHVIIDDALYRPSEILFNKGNAAKALTELSWKAQLTAQELDHYDPNFEVIVAVRAQKPRY